MRLAIILATVGICALGYTVYSSVVEEKYKKTRVEGEVGDMLDQLIEHIHAYTQYYERRTWERHTAIRMTEQGMAMPQGEQRDLLREQMGKYVKQYNMYEDAMAPFYKEELYKAWNIALDLKDKELHNPEQAALFHQCWQDMVPYVLHEGYFHATLSDREEHRKQIVQEKRTQVIKRKQEYVETHKEMLQWEQDYAHLQGEDIMAQAELATAKLDMEAADHALALLLAANSEPEAINQAMAHVSEQVVLYKEAELKAEQVDRAMQQLETARMDMNNDRLEQVLMAHQQPGEELHPNLPRGARVVPGNDVQPPPAGGGWWSEFVQWICSWIF